jgi:hypothetical protein
MKKLLALLLILFTASISEASYFSAKKDDATGVNIGIDYAHHELHEGSHYWYMDANTLANGSSIDFLITTPNTTEWAHILFVLDGVAVTSFKLYEDSSATGTTAQTVYNSDRNSSHSNTVTVHKGVNAISGTLIKNYSSGLATGASAKMGSETRTEEEVILKQNSKYLLHVLSGTNGNLTNVKFEWYEHTNE